MCSNPFLVVLLATLAIVLLRGSRQNPERSDGGPIAISLAAALAQGILFPILWVAALDAQSIGGRTENAALRWIQEAFFGDLSLAIQLIWFGVFAALAAWMTLRPPFRREPESSRAPA
jgi:FtsH-binding integral membrane protein